MITVDSLSVRMAEREILTGLDFRVNSGDYLAVMGPNGGGKSTLIKVILGLIPPTSGSLIFDGGHRPAVGYVPQIKTLDRSFPARAEELVETAITSKWPLRKNKQSIGLVRQAMYEVGVGHLIGQAISSLSGGELQRVYLARALLGAPPLLILDEPSAGVDMAGTADFLELVEHFRRESGITIVMVTHDWDIALHHASRVLLLKGSQISFGPPSEALADDAVREAFGHVGHAHGVLAGGHTHG